MNPVLKAFDQRRILADRTAQQRSETQHAANADQCGQDLPATHRFMSSSQAMK
jgi:hypothetical protein